MKMVSAKTYRFVRLGLSFIMRLAHPVVRVRGRENLPEGPAVLCCNHSSFSDPIWVQVAAKLKRLPRTMAKKELLEIPVLGWLYTKLGAFPVDRTGRDIAAVRTAMNTLREGNKVLIFPEGTRIRKGKVSEPHNGALMIAAHEHVPVVPIYLTAHKHFFGRIDVVFGEAYKLACEKPKAEELTEMTQSLMKRIYAMGENL